MSPDTPRAKWHIGRVIKTFPGKDGQTRVVRVQVGQQELTRPITKLQSLSEVVGTHVGSACKWIITVFYTIPLPSASPQPNQCCFNQNSSNLTRNGTQH